jgi:hypothetical protein
VRNSEGVSPSLWLRLIIGLVSVSLLAVGAASGALYLRFKAKNWEFREQTLRNQAGVIADYLKSAPDGPIQLPNYVTETFTTNNGRYAIVDKSRQLLAGSAGVTAPLAAINPSEPRDSFALQADENEAPYYGLSVRTPFAGRLVWVQVAFHAGNIVYDSVLEESYRTLPGSGSHSSSCSCWSICWWRASGSRRCAWPPIRRRPSDLALCPCG